MLPQREEKLLRCFGAETGGTPYLLTSIIIFQIPRVPCAVSLLWRGPQNIYTCTHIYYIHINVYITDLVLVCGFMGSFLVEESTLYRLPNKVDIQVLKKAVFQIPSSSDPSCVRQ